MKEKIGVMRKAVQFVRENRDYLSMLRKRDIGFKRGSRVLDLPSFHDTKNMEEKIHPVTKKSQEGVVFHVVLREGVTIRPFFDPAEASSRAEDNASYNG